MGHSQIVFFFFKGSLILPTFIPPFGASDEPGDGAASRGSEQAVARSAAADAGRLQADPKALKLVLATRSTLAKKIYRLDPNISNFLMTTSRQIPKLPPPTYTSTGICHSRTPSRLPGPEQFQSTYLLSLNT